MPAPNRSRASATAARTPRRSRRNFLGAAAGTAAVSATGLLATRESHRSDRQHSAIRCRSSNTWGTPRWLSCALVARPAWPPPTMRNSTSSLAIAELPG